MSGDNHPMRFDRRLASWHGDRGFGFIALTQGGQEIFMYGSISMCEGEVGA